MSRSGPVPSYLEHNQDRVPLPPEADEGSWSGRRTISTRRRRTPASLSKALQARWQNPTRIEKRQFGDMIWETLQSDSFGEVLTREGVEAVLTMLLTQEFAESIWRSFPKEQLLDEGNKIHNAGLTLEDVLGPAAIEQMKEDAGRAWKPNRDLAEKLMDQPFLRQALRNLVQRSIQQFLQQINPLQSSRKVPGGRMLGTIGRGVARRAEKAARMGKSLVEGVGGGLYRQLEDQIQPFLSAFMNRSVQTLSEALFEGEQQAKLAREARLHVLEVLLKTPLATLLPGPKMSRMERQLGLMERVSGHLMSIEGYPEGVGRLVTAIHRHYEKMSVAEVIEELRIPVEASPEFAEALGALGYHLLAQSSAASFLKHELEAIW